MDIATLYAKLVEMNEGSDPGDFTTALIAATLKSEGYSAADEARLGLAGRIYDVCTSTDESRFTWYDYVDAIVNWPQEIKVEKLMALSDEDLEEAIIYMAYRKRETYSFGMSVNEYAEKLVASLQEVR